MLNCELPMDEREEEYKFIAPGFKNVVVLKYFYKTQLWFAYYEHESNHLIGYDSSGKTAEEAVDKFIRYRINGEPVVSTYTITLPTAIEYIPINLTMNWTVDANL